MIGCDGGGGGGGISCWMDGWVIGCDGGGGGGIVVGAVKDNAGSVSLLSFCQGR